MVKVPAAQPAPRVPRSRRDDRYETGRPAPPKRATAGYVISIQDTHDTVTVDVLDEELTGVIPLGEMPPVGAIVEVEARGDLLVIPVWYPGPPPAPYAFIDAYDPSDSDTESGWNTSAFPNVSDDSDATFIYFSEVDASGHTPYHDRVLLVGNPEVIPAADSAPVTSIRFTLRCRRVLDEGDSLGEPMSVSLQLRTPGGGSAGYLQYEGPDPVGDYGRGLAIPVGPGWTDVVVTLDDADVAATGGDDAAAWSQGGTGDWATLADVIGDLRTLGGFEVFVGHVYTWPDSQWDIAYANLTFDV